VKSRLAEVYTELPKREEPTVGKNSPNVVSEPPSSTRRSFFKRLSQILIGLWVAGFSAGIISFLRRPGRLQNLAETTVEAGPLDGLSPGQGRLVTGSHRPFWVILAPNQQVVALPAVCTHLHCILDWDEDRGQLVCPCHLGTFDLNGNVLSGPPPRSLALLPVMVRGGKIYVYA
jgi:cytochrome b6-f complex iron-sulfur subunit